MQSSAIASPTAAQSRAARAAHSDETRSFGELVTAVNVYVDAEGVEQARAGCAVVDADAAPEMAWFAAGDRKPNRSYYALLVVIAGGKLFQILTIEGSDRNNMTASTKVS